MQKVFGNLLSEPLFETQSDIRESTMIVREENQQLVCVTQREHAALSEKLYEAFTDPVEPIAAAIHHHDDGWSESDEAPDLKNGRVVDYRSIPLEEHLGILKRSAKRSARHHPYAGWLVSRHGCSFHENKTGEPVDAFLANQREYRDELRKLIGETLFENWEVDFDWLQFTDAVSLFVLDPWAETHEWTRDTPGPAVLTGQTDTGFSLATDSLEPTELTLEYDYRTVPDDALESEREFRDSLSRRETRTGKIALRVARE